MCSKSNFKVKNKTPLVILVLFLSAPFLLQVSLGKAKNTQSKENQLVFPLKYKGEAISTDAQLNHYLSGDTICTSTATWEITLFEGGTLYGSYINLNPKAASNGECVSIYDNDHPSRGENRINFSGIHSDGYFEITESNLYYDYTNTQFRGHDKNIQGYYDATHIYTSPSYRYESNTYSNWTDMFGHEFDLPLIGGAINEEDSGQDPVIVEDSGQDVVIGDESEGDPVVRDDGGGIDPLIPVIGIGVASAAGAAVAAGATAVAVSRGKNGRVKKKDDKQDKKKKDPCLDELNRLKEASIQAHSLHDGIQTLRSYLATLETMYENVRQSAYWNASIDLGLLGASIFGAPLTVGLTGKAIASQTIVRAMTESAATSLGAEMLKSVTNGMLEQGVSWEGLAKAPYGGAESVVIKEVITDLLTQRFNTGLIQQGTPRTVRLAKVKGYTKQVASKLGSAVTQLISLAKIGIGAYEAAEKLEFLREELGEMRKALFEMELQFEDLLSEMKISRSVYNKCRQTWQL